MSAARAAIALALVVLLGVPLAFRPSRAAPPEGARELIVVTPHNEQIRFEFGRAFDAWHARVHGERVHVVWAAPGGTSEITKLLRARYEADLARDDGRDVGGSFDCMLGGGSYEHGRLARPLRVVVGGEERTTTISVPIDVTQAWLDEIYGENRIGDGRLYDPDRHWLGTALSMFGIVSNRDALADAGVETPTRWADLADPRLRGWVALVNPARSGSITTAFQAVLQHRGWVEGWRILRRAAANARHFSLSSSKAPVDVSMGDAAAAVCIDFYGRYQAQAIAEAGDPGRLVYVDPPGETTVDADPVSILRGAPHPELARRFVEFCLSEEGQALWQLRADDPAADGLGPERYELRRMPIRRDMYDRHLDRFVDRVSPYELARPAPHADRSMRAFIPVVFAAMAVDAHEPLRRAWRAIVEHPAYPGGGLVTAADVADPDLRRRLEAFDALPLLPTPDGTLPLGDPAALGALEAGWLRGGWADAGLWPDEMRPREALRRDLVRFFVERYEAAAADR